MPQYPKFLGTRVIDKNGNEIVGARNTTGVEGTSCGPGAIGAPGEPGTLIDDKAEAMRQMQAGESMTLEVNPSESDQELGVMQACIDQLKTLDHGQRGRIMDYLYARFR